MKTIIDVRSIGEFNSGNAPGSINVPLQEIPERLEELREKAPLVLCCASGARSAHATQFLKEQGIECENAGAWENLA